jgi:hypothetical protein
VFPALIHRKHGNRGHVLAIKNGLECVGDGMKLVYEIGQVNEVR